jgi:hypothetical protein
MKMNKVDRDPMQGIDSLTGNKDTDKYKNDYLNTNVINAMIYLIKIFLKYEKTFSSQFDNNM